MATKTIAYSTTGDYWKTRYSFAPSCYAYVDNRLITCTNRAGNQAYLHTSSAERCNYYGSSNVVSLTFASNENPSANKFFKTLSIESDYDNWDCAISTYSDSVDMADRQLTFISGQTFSKREGTSYIDIPRSSQSSTNHIRYSGTRAETQVIGSFVDLASVPLTGSFGTESVVISYDINNNPVCVVDGNVVPYSGQSNAATARLYDGLLSDGVEERRLFIYNGSGPSAVASPSNANTIKNNAAFQQIYTLTPARIDGDFMRGKACTITLESGSVANGLELYAVNVDFEYSELDSRLG